MSVEKLAMGCCAVALVTMLAHGRARPSSAPVTGSGGSTAAAPGPLLTVNPVAYRQRMLVLAN
ncbi:MAG: hypothetical protein ACRD2F_15995, partial [Terriglobales bacterium]